MSDRSSQYGHNSRNKKYGAGEQFAIRRLLKELKEIRTYPMPNVVAEPTEEDLFTWHGNLRGPAQSPFEGGVFHFVIHFPRNYPNSAPTININDSIPGHPFVEGNSICLSLLENSRGRNDNWYYGWTPVYTAGSILRQLQTVLVDGLESFRDSAGYNVSFTQKQTSQWKIVFDNRDTQGEGTLDPEQIRELLLEVGERKPSEEELALHYRMLNFPKDQPIDFSTFLRILERKRDFRRVVETANKYHCPHKTCSHAPQHPYPAFPSVDKQNAAGQALVEKSYERIRLEETVCFHSKQSPTEPDNATLGVGLSFQRDFRNGKIHRISSSMDLVSLNAFRKWGINYSAGTERETFTHWLPMYLNAEHGARAMHLAPRCFGIICNGSHRDFKVDMVTEIIPKLMSGLILEIVKGGSQLAIQALHGYTYLHQLFLALVQRYPHLGEIIKQQLTDFIADPENRVKDKFSNLTDVLCLLSVAEGIDFKAAFTAVMEEMNIRNVIWIVKKYPELNKDTPDAKLDAERINKSFVASRVGFQVVLFHRFFLDHIARPKSATNEQVLAAYEATWGRPTVEQEENLLVEYERIFSLPSYEEAYHRVQVDVPDQAAYLQILLNAVKVSSERSYHGKRKITVQSVDEYLKQKVKNYINLDDLIDQEKSDELTQQRNVPDEKFFVLKDDEEFWKKNCGERFGALELPESDDIVSEIQQPWRHLYLKLNLEDIICKFNENPDFKRFYRTVELSAYHLRLLELTVVPVTNVKSNFYYITALLTKLYHLEKFVIHKGEITLGLKGCKALCKGLKNNPNSLRALDIHYCHFTSECVKIVEEGLLSSHGLLALNLEGNPLGAEGAKSIAAVLQAHGGITHLNITSCGITDDGARQLADAFYHNKSLRVIHMGKNPWTHVGFAQIIHKLAYSRTIEELHLQHISESINNLAVSAAFTRLFEVTTSLKYVNFFKTKVSRILDETSIHGLSQNRSLTELDLSNTGFEGNENFKHLGFALARNRNIIKLDLEQASAQPNSLAIISQAIHDSESAIEERKKAAKVRPLNAFEITEELRPRGCSLQHLNYSGNSTSVSSPIESKALSRLISLTTSLTSLNLSSCNLDVLAGEAIGNGVRNHPALLTLDVSRNNLGEYGIKKLCKGLAENNVIQELNLSRNKSGGRGISAVAQLMTNPNTNIRVLNIYGNLIGIEGARFVATALETNKTVTDLDLGLNRIRAKGTSAIAASLTKNNTLQILRLKQNFINDRPAMELAKVLVAHKSITKLCIAGNRVKDAILNSIVSSLAERNPPATVDIAQLLKVTENSVLQRTIYCTPLSMDVSENSLKKVFYDGGCGAIVKVSIIKHSKRTSFDKACFAFIEFAEQGSVQLALDIGAEQKSRIGKKKFSVIQAQGKAGHGSVVTPQ